MNIAIIAGKYDGCGVSTYIFELQRSINEYIGKADVFIYDCPSFFTNNDYKNIKEKGLKLISRNKNDVVLLNSYDYVFAAYHVVTWQVSDSEANGYYNMLEFDITTKKAIIFNEHRPSSIIKHYAGGTINCYCLRPSFLLSFDKILQYGDNTTTAAFLRDLIGDAEYLKRYVPLYLMYHFDENKNWAKAEDKLKTIEFLGRAVVFKDPHRLLRAKEYFDNAGFMLEMRGLGIKNAIENQPDFVYQSTSDGLFVDKTKLSTKTYWVDENDLKKYGYSSYDEMINLPLHARNNKVFIYGKYDKDTIYDYLKYSAFVCDFFNLSHIEDYANQSYEYCMTDSINAGIIPIFDETFGENCYQLENAELTNRKFINNYSGLYCKKDLSDIEKLIDLLKRLYSNSMLYDTYRENIYDFWKIHTEPKAIVEKLMNDLNK